MLPMCIDYRDYLEHAFTLSVAGEPRGTVSIQQQLVAITQHHPMSAKPTVPPASSDHLGYRRTSIDKSQGGSGDEDLQSFSISFERDFDDAGVSRPT